MCVTVLDVYTGFWDEPCIKMEYSVITPREGVVNRTARFFPSSRDLWIDCHYHSIDSTFWEQTPEQAATYGEDWKVFIESGGIETICGGILNFMESE